MPKVAWSAMLFPAVLLVAIITGCGPDANDPEVKKQIQERRAAIREDEAKDNALAKSRKGKKAAVAKSIKSGLGGAGQAD
jgi:hypothetical protein